VFDEEVVKEVFGEDGFLVGLLDSGTVLFFLLLGLCGRRNRRGGFEEANCWDRW